MFTGIITDCGKISAIEKGVQGLRLSLNCQYESIEAGESIAVNGVCLTALASDDGYFQCDISPETLALTNLNTLSRGQHVNLERALTMDTRLSGHIVTGHVDETACISKLRERGEYIELRISDLSQQAQPFLMKKGGVSVDGVSLTINELGEDYIELMLIPHTVEHTRFKYAKTGDPVNIEYDYLARLFVRQYQLSQGTVKED